MTSWRGAQGICRAGEEGISWAGAGGGCSGDPISMSARSTPVSGAECTKSVAARVPRQPQTSMLCLEEEATSPSSHFVVNGRTEEILT